MARLMVNSDTTSPRRGLAAPIWIVAIVALIFLLREASQLLIPIVLAVLISYALEPVVAWLARRRVPRMLGAALVLGSILGVFGWGAYNLRDDAAQALQTLPEAARRARQLLSPDGGPSAGHQVQQAVEALQGSSPSQSDSPSGSPPQSSSSPQSGPQDGSSSGSPDSGQPVAAGPIGAWVQRGIGSAVALAGNLTVIVFLVFFLLASGHHFKNRIVEIAGSPLERRRITATIINDIDAQVQRFLLVRLITAVIVAAATWGVLVWLGVEQAAVWATLAGVFNSIPYFGPIIVSGGLLVVGLMQSGDPMQGVRMAGAALVITSLEGWLLTPPLLGKAERMHVVVVFLGVLVWTWIWGAWGTILAVPMLVVLKSVADHVEWLKPVRRLMAP
jgi:predicted PurR-regulated permease PerM